MLVGVRCIVDRAYVGDGRYTTMQQWRVSDVMTTEVITTPEHTPVTKLVDIMSTHGVSAVPIVADDNRVVGVVSQADLLTKIAAAADPGPRGQRRGMAAKATATSARELMSTPALSISPDESLSAAAKTMQAKNVKRLIVTGDAGELLGIVSRADLLRLYARPDTAIRQDVIDHVLRRAVDRHQRGRGSRRRRPGDSDRRR
jgi:CBS domain-containing protein